MKALEMRGSAFRRRRVDRGLSTDKVAAVLRIPRRNVVAYEIGIIMQLPRDAESKLASLNSKWTTEDLKRVHRSR